MKYVAIFIVVFLTGFGLLQLLDKEEIPTTPNSIEDSPKLNEDSLKTTGVVPVIEEDTFTYKKIDGYFNLQWSDLARVTFEEKFNDTFNTMIPYPIFHPSIKKLNSQPIQIKGYVIPFEETGDTTIVILSAFPFSNCFFCGGAGPETVMDVQMKKQGTPFKQDAMHTFRGKLRLNDSDLDYLNYILDEAEIID